MESNIKMNQRNWI